MFRSTTNHGKVPRNTASAERSWIWEGNLQHMCLISCPYNSMMPHEPNARWPFCGPCALLVSALLLGLPAQHPLALASRAASPASATLPPGAGVRVAPSQERPLSPFRKTGGAALIRMCTGVGALSMWRSASGWALGTWRWRAGQSPLPFLYPRFLLLFTNGL
jgi:hypothetical protein